MNRIALIVPAAALSAALAPAAAGAHTKSSTVKVGHGATTVTLNAATAKILTGAGAGELGLTLGVLRPAAPPSRGSRSR